MIESPPTTADKPISHGPAATESPLRIRYRIRFAKTGLLRWISHRDLARLWERLVRRAELQLSMTEGFHPKPRIAFPSALALAVESLDEVVELELTELMSPAVLLERLLADDQPGLTIHSVARLPDGFGKAQLAKSDYIITAADSSDLSAASTAIAQLLAQSSVSVERKNKRLTLQLASQIPSLELCGNELRLSLNNTDGASLKPTDVLHLLGLDDWIENGASITRTHVHLEKEFFSDDPSMVAVAENSTGLRP